jgi:hypothetical protein
VTENELRIFLKSSITQVCEEEEEEEEEEDGFTSLVMVVVMVVELVL